MDYINRNDNQRRAPRPCFEGRMRECQGTRQRPPPAGSKISPYSDDSWDTPNQGLLPTRASAPQQPALQNPRAISMRAKQLRQAGRSAEADAVLIRGLALYPQNVFLWNQRIGLHRGRNAVASRLFSEMQQAGVDGDVVTYNTLIDAFGKAKQPEGAWATFEAMQSAGIDGNAVTCCTLIDVFGARPNSQRAHGPPSRPCKAPASTATWSPTTPSSMSSKLWRNDQLAHRVRANRQGSLRHAYSIHVACRCSCAPPGVLPIFSLVKVLPQPTTDSFLRGWPLDDMAFWQRDDTRGRMEVT